MHNELLLRWILMFSQILQKMPPANTLQQVLGVAGVQRDQTIPTSSVTLGSGKKPKVGHIPWESQASSAWGPDKRWAHAPACSIRVQRLDCKRPVASLVRGGARGTGGLARATLPKNEGAAVLKECRRGCGHHGIGCSQPWDAEQGRVHKHRPFSVCYSDGSLVGQC
jgi:hypothetical protein